MAKATKDNFRPMKRNNYKTVVRMAEGGNVSELNYSERKAYIEENYAPFITEAKMTFSIWDSNIEYDYKANRESVINEIIESYQELGDYTEKTLPLETVYEIQDWDLVRRDIDPETDEVIGETSLTEIKADNTYNFSYLGLVDLNWRVYHDKEYEKYFYVIMPHLGGDIRGNYGDAIILEGNDADELFYRFYEGFINGGASIYFKFKDGSELGFDSEKDNDVFYFRYNESFSPTGMALKYVEDFEKFDTWEGDEFLEETVDIFLMRKGIAPKMMAGGRLDDETPKAYIQILGYDEGKWVDLTDFSDGSDVIDYISDWMDELNEKLGGNREEYEVTDYEGFGKNLYDRYMGSNEFDEILEGYEKYENSDFPAEVISTYKNDSGNSGYSMSEIIDEMENNYLGKFSDYSDFGYRQVEDGFYSPTDNDVYVTDTDKRIIAGEESDNQVNDMDFDDLIEKADDTRLEYEKEKNDLENRIEEVEGDIDDLKNLQESTDDQDDFDNISEQIEEKELELEEVENKLEDIDSRYEESARNEVREIFYDEIYDELERNLSSFLDRYGYSDELENVSFLSVDYEKIGEDLASEYLVVEYEGSLYIFNNYSKGGRIKASKTKNKYDFYIVENSTKKLVSGYSTKAEAIEQRRLLIEQYPAMRFEIYPLAKLETNTALDVNAKKDYVELSTLDKIKKVSVDALRYGQDKVGQAQMFLQKNDVKGKIKRGARNVADKTKQGTDWLRNKWLEADFGDGTGRAKFFADGGEVGEFESFKDYVRELENKEHEKYIITTTDMYLKGKNWKSYPFKGKKEFESFKDYVREMENKEHEKYFLATIDMYVSDRDFSYAYEDGGVAKLDDFIKRENIVREHLFFIVDENGKRLEDWARSGDNILRFQEDWEGEKWLSYEDVVTESILKANGVNPNDVNSIVVYDLTKGEQIFNGSQLSDKEWYDYIKFLKEDTYEEYADGGAVDLYKDATEKSKKEIEFLLDNGYTIEAYSKEDRDLVFGEDDNVIFATQGGKGDTKNTKEFAVAYLYEDDDSGVMQIDKDLMDWIADGFSNFPVTVYTNAGVDLHSKNKGKYKNITFKRFPVKFADGGEIEKLNLTELETNILRYFLSQLDVYQLGYSDTSVDDIANGINVNINSVKGSVGSLTKKGIIFVSDLGEGIGTIVYLQDDYEYLHPEYKDYISQQYADGGMLDTDYSYQGNTFFNGEYKPVYKKDGNYYIKHYNPTHYSHIGNEEDIKNYNLVKMYSDGGKLGYYELQDLKNQESILEERLHQVIDNQTDGWKIDKALIESELELVRKEISKMESSKFAGGGVLIYKETDLNRRDGKTKIVQLTKVDSYREALERIEELKKNNKNPNVRFFTGNIYADGGVISSKVDELYKKSNFINDDYNWTTKLLEMLQDNSIEAYDIYQSLTEEQKKQVLDELYSMDNDMGSYSDGDIETSKENLMILLDGAKNGEKYANGGSMFPNGGVAENVSYAIFSGDKKLSSVYLNDLGYTDKYVGRDDKDADRFGMKKIPAPRKLFVFRDNSWLSFKSKEDAMNKIDEWKENIDKDDRYTYEIKKSLIKSAENLKKNIFPIKLANGGGVSYEPMTKPVPTTKPKERTKPDKDSPYKPKGIPKPKATKI